MECINTVLQELFQQILLYKRVAAQVFYTILYLVVRSIFLPFGFWVNLEILEICLAQFETKMEDLLLRFFLVSLIRLMVLPFPV